MLLEAARAARLRYVQVSTDEVYGSIESGSFTEESPLRPSSPYSATKTGADLLVQSYFHTYDLQAVIARGSNNYGPNQYPEKLIPLMILNALHGDRAAGVRRRHAGAQLDPRDGLLARDRARARARRARRGLQRGRALTRRRTSTWSSGSSRRRAREESQIEYVADRPGHDRRYSLSSEKVRALGWSPQVRFAEGLEQTVAWYRDNSWWWEPIRSGDYRAYYERQYGRSLA